MTIQYTYHVTYSGSLVIHLNPAPTNIIPEHIIDELRRPVRKQRYYIQCNYTFLIRPVQLPNRSVSVIEQCSVITKCYNFQNVNELIQRRGKVKKPMFENKYPLGSVLPWDKSIRHSCDAVGNTASKGASICRTAPYKQHFA